MPDVVRECVADYPHSLNEKPHILLEEKFGF